MNCVECGTPLPGTGDCWTRVHELLEIETRELQRHDPEVAKRAHYFAIATYQLQHPSRLTTEAVHQMRSGVASMLEDQPRIASLRRAVGRFAKDHKITRKAPPGDHSHLGTPWPTAWEMTALDVIGAPDEQYVARTTEWAAATVRAIDAAVPPD